MGELGFCLIDHESFEEEEACEVLRLARIPECSNCIPQKIESHPRYPIVRCANCKEWLA